MKKPSSIRVRTLSLVVLIALLVTVPATAKRSPGPTVLLAPDEAESFIQRGNTRISLDSGLPRALYHVDYRVSPDTPEAMASQYLRDNADTLGLASTDLSDLRHHATRNGLSADVVRFRQHVDGVPVYGAEVTITINRKHRVTYVMSTYQPVGEVDTTPRVSAETARQAAHALVGVEGELSWQREDLVIYHNKGVSRLARRLTFYPRVSPIGEWEVLVDAHSGEIFRAADVAHYAPVDGDGEVFDPDPLSSATVPYGGVYGDGGDADTTELNAERFNRPLLDIDLTGGTHTLVGPWAEIIDNESPFKGLFGQASSSFSFTRFEDGFEAAHTYYHLDTYMRYLNITLGLNITPYQYSGGVRYDPHGLNGSDNSHYTSAGIVAFGEGGVDDAEDADVVIHELGHGLHDWVTSGGLSQVNGLSEGTGDYIAQSYSRFLGNWTPADAAYHWVFSWDGHNPFWPGRVTNYGAIYPGGLVGQIHTDGQIWATCNMKIWDAIGRELTDTAFWEGLGMTNGGTNQQDAAQAVLQAAFDMGYSSGDLTTMEGLYQGCGYTVSLPAMPLFEDDFETGDTSMWTVTNG